MRVITGTARGRRLKTPENYDIRPTTDNVKESVFNIIQFDIEGRRVLDLFAGTGQLGIECLSRGRGGGRVHRREHGGSEDSQGEPQDLRLHGGGTAAGRAELSAALREFDLVFVDPPYDSGLYESVLETINSVDILSDGGIILCESRREKTLRICAFLTEKRKSIATAG